MTGGAEVTGGIDFHAFVSPIRSWSRIQRRHVLRGEPRPRRRHFNVASIAKRSNPNFSFAFGAVASSRWRIERHGGPGGSRVIPSPDSGQWRYPVVTASITHCSVAGKYDASVLATLATNREASRMYQSTIPTASRGV
jgi:hypothetical protein